MANYSLGTAEGTIKIGYDGKGINQANRGLQTFQDKARNAQRSLTTVATVTGAAAGVIATGIGFAVNAAIDFEKRLSAIGAVSGATGKQMDALRKKALQLGADTAFSASDAALAMEELVKAGLSVSDVLNGAADATVALAAAGSIDLPQAATIAANAMNQFGLSARELPRVADLIAGAANASAISVSDFGLSLQQAGAVAKLNGLNFKDLAVAIALMGNAGIRGSDAGTSLKTMLSNLIPTTKTQIELSKKLGLITRDGGNAFFDAAGHVKSLSDVAGILHKALSGLTDEQKSLALQTLFGSDAIRAAAIIADAGSQGFEKLANSMSKISAADVAKERMNNVAGAIEQLKGSVETAAIAFGTTLLPAIRKIADFITVLVNKFSALDPKWQKLIAFAAVAAVAILGFIAAIAGVAAVVAGMIASFAAIKIGVIIVGVVAAIAALVAIIKIASDKSQAFRDLLSRIGEAAKAGFGAILAIVKPIADFFKNTLIPAVTRIAQTLLTNLAPAFKAIGEFVSTRILPAFQKLQAAFAKAMPTIMAVGKVILAVAGFILNILGKALGFIIPLLLKIIGPIFTVLIAVIAGVISFIPKLVTGFMAVVNVFKVIGEVILAAVIGPLKVIWTIGKFIFEQLLKVVKVFVDGFMVLWNFLWPITKAVFDLISAAVRLAFAVISAMFQAFKAATMAIWNALWNAIIGPAISAFKATKDAIATAVAWIITKITAFGDFVKGIFAKFFAWIVPPITSAFNTVKQIISDKMAAAKALVKTIWDAIVGFFTGAKTKIVTAINNLTAIITRMREIFTDMKDAAIKKAEELITWVKGLPGKIVAAIGNLSGKLLGAGKALLQGFWDGLKSVWDSIVSWMTGAMDKLRGLWPFSPAKWGPFSGRGWTLFSGRALMEGFAKGMAERAGAVNKAASRALAGVADNLPTDFSATVGTTTASLAAGAGTSPGGIGAGTSTTTTSNTTVNLNVPLDDLRSIRDVQDLLDFVDRIRNDSRRGLVNA